MAFAQSPCAHRKQITEHFYLTDAFNNNLMFINDITVKSS